MEAVKPTNPRRARSLHTHGCASSEDNEKSVFLSQWQVYFCRPDVKPRGMAQINVMWVSRCYTRANLGTFVVCGLYRQSHQSRYILHFAAQALKGKASRLRRPRVPVRRPVFTYDRRPRCTSGDKLKGKNNNIRCLSKACFLALILRASGEMLHHSSKK